MILSEDNIFAGGFFGCGDTTHEDIRGMKAGGATSRTEDLSAGARTMCGALMVIREHRVCVMKKHPVRSTIFMQSAIHRAASRSDRDGMEGGDYSNSFLILYQVEYLTFEENPRSEYFPPTIVSV